MNSAESPRSEQFPAGFSVVSIGIMTATAMAAATALQSALAVLATRLQSSFGLSVSGYGVAFAMFSLSGALIAAPVGSLYDRLSSTKLIVIFLFGAASSLLMVSIAWRAEALVAAILIGGVANAGINIGTTDLLGKSFNPKIMGRQMGIKQSGAYLAVILASLLPSMEARLGWRGAVALLALIPLGALTLVPRKRLRVSRTSESVHPESVAVRTSPSLEFKRSGADREIAVRPLVLIAFFISIGISGALAFLPMYAEIGLSFPPGAVGLLIFGVGVIGAVARVAWGTVADRQSAIVRLLVVSSIMSVVGGLLLLLSTTGSAILAVLGALLIAGSGMAWHSLGFLAVVRGRITAPVGHTAGRVLRSTLVGFIAGPIACGAAVDVGGLGTEWLIVLASFLAALGVSSYEAIRMR